VNSFRDSVVVLIASPDTSMRSSLSQELAARGDRVILCAAPWTGHGSCPLMRDERCALQEVADIAVVSAEAPRAAAAGAPATCALSARRAVVTDSDAVTDVITMIDDRLLDEV